MRRITKLGVALSVPVLTMSGCAAAQSSSRAEIAGPAPDSVPAQREADRVFTTFNGSTLERNAGAVLRAYELNGGMDVCMNAAGYPEWDWSMARGLEPTNRGLGTSVFFAPPLSRSHTDALMEAAPGIAAEAELRSYNPTAQEATAITRCINSDTEADLGEVPKPPPAAPRLRELWWQMVAQLDDEFGDATTYSACLADQPIPGLGAVDSADDANAQLEALHPPVRDIPLTPADPLASSDAWQRLLSAEAAWERLDWGCRSGTYNAHLDDVVSVIKDFEAVHAKEILAARAGWNPVLERATELGYDGTFSSLGS